MAKYYYNGVLLPEIPADVLAEYPYAYMAGETSFCAFSVKPYFYPTAQYPSCMKADGAGVQYRINEETGEWELSKSYENMYVIISGIVWSNYDIPNGSATSSTIYFYATEPLDADKVIIGCIQTDLSSTSLSSATGNYELGADYLCKKNVVAVAVRVYIPEGSQKIKGTLWDETGAKLTESNEISCSGDEWYTLFFRQPIILEAGKMYTVSAGYSAYYVKDPSSLTFSPVFDFVQSKYGGTIGSYPSTVFNQKLYGLVDIVYQDPDYDPDEPTLRTSGYLIQSGDSIFTVTDGVLTAVDGSLTAELFRTYGVDEIPSSDLLVTLTEPVVYYWTTADEITPLVAVVQGVPFTQTLESEDYDMTDETILGIETVIVDASDDCLFAVSFDAGHTWKIHTGEAWATLSEGDTGMSPSVLSAITTEDWNAEATTGKFRFRVTLPSVDSYLNSLVVDYLN